jgi:hypothetical protein
MSKTNLLATTTAITLWATSAMAGPPLPVPGQPVPVSPFIQFLPAGLGCPDFNLEIKATGGKLHTKTFVDENGKPVRLITAGKGFLLTYTNLDTGQSIQIATGGSVSSTQIHPDGDQTVTLTGHNGLVLFPNDVPAGPSTTQYIGKTVYEIDFTTGVFTLIRESPNQRDVCAELSD